MPEYQIQAPDGNTYQIQGPAGASRDDVIARVSAKFPGAAKPKATSGPTALGIAKGAGAVGGDVVGGLLNPKELTRETYHSITDYAGHTLKAAADLADWIGEKTGLREAVGETVWTGKSLTAQDRREGKRPWNLEGLISDALTSEKLVREPQTVTGRAVKDIGEFTLSMATAGKVFGIANKTLQGGIAAWTVFDPQGGRLSDLLQKYPSLRNPVTNFLKSDPDDSVMEARLKNAAEGIAGGKVAEAFVRGLNLLRTAMRGKVAAKAFEIASEDKPRARVDPKTGQLAPMTTSTATQPGPKTDYSVDQDGIHTVTSPNGKTTAKKRGDSLQILDTQTSEAGRGKGEGTVRIERLVQEAQALKLTLVSDTKVSASAAKVYDSLEKKGYKVVRNPHEKLDDGELISTASRPVFEVEKMPPGTPLAQSLRKPVFEVKQAKPGAKESQQQFTARAMAELHGRQEAKVEAASQAAAGKRPDLEGGVAKGAEAVEAETKGPKPMTPEEAMQKAFSPAPLAGRALGQMQEWWKWTQQLVAPGSVSPETKQAEADIAAAYAQHMQHIEERFQRSPERREFWNTNLKKVAQFIQGFEKDLPLKDKDLERARAFYKSWMARTAAAEKAAGIEYEAQDHYIPHLFEDQKGVQEWLREQGAKSVGFAKERTFSLYEQAVKAGFKPRFTNPEEIFQARQHASDMALTKIQSMRHLVEDGLAIEGKEGRGEYRASYSTSDGRTYWVHDDAKLLLNRMFDERSLWSDRSPLGSMYRGMVALKNNLIPVRLAFSLFHPLHVLTMHVLAASATRSFKAGEWMPSRYQQGSRMLSMLRGEIPNAQLTQADRQDLQHVSEGGLILEQDPRYRTQALEKLRTAFQNSSPGALLHVHTGALQAIQNVVFRTWIPSLKGASYLADVRAALKAQPSLIDDAASRRVALRRIAKSVENRYGEMNYSTLFWNRLFRDVSVMSATSMGWQLGLFREYGGGAGQLANALGKMAVNPRNARQVFQALKKSGDLDKLIYVANYSTIAATLGGLVTWAMTNQRPTETMDFFAPRTGETNPDGTPARVRTMFYPYEFAAMTKRVQNQGPAKAAAEWVAAKGTGIPSMLAETWTGVDGLGRQIRDPNGTVMEQTRQTLNAILKENYPISLQQRGAALESTKQRVLDIAGMSKAPRYLQETKGEASIEQLWEKQYKTAETPFTQSVRSGDRQKLEAAMHSGDSATVDKVLPDMVQKFNLRSQDARRLARDASLGLTSYQALFREMRADDQRAILKKMEPGERQKYLPYAKRLIQAEFQQ